MLTRPNKTEHEKHDLQVFQTLFENKPNTCQTKRRQQNKQKHRQHKQSANNNYNTMQHITKPTIIQKQQTQNNCKLTLYIPVVESRSECEKGIAIPRPLSMFFHLRIDESNRLFKGFQMVPTIMARIAQIGPRSSKSSPRPDLLSERGV